MIAALSASAVTIIYFGIFWLGIVMLLWMGIKLLVNGNWHYLFITIVLCFLMALRCYYDRINLDQHQIINRHTNFIIIIEPDQINFYDGYISGQGYIDQFNQTVRIVGMLPKNQIEQLNELGSKTIQLSVNAEVESLSGATNFNQFDFATYYRTQNITHTLKIKSLQSVSVIGSFNLMHLIHQLRAQWIQFANQLPHPLNLYFSSLVLGVMNRSLMNEITGMKQLGLIHLFSISGFHVYFLIGIIRWILSSLKIRKEFILLMMILFLPLYFIFAGASIGLLRAILTAILSILSKLFQSRTQRLNIWGLVLIINLMIAPESLLQLGCQLSYCLSLGLLFTETTNFWRQTVLMNLLSVPIIIYHLYEWHVLSLTANWFILPLFSVLVMPLVMLGGISFHFVPLLSNGVAWIIDKLDLITNEISSLPGNILFGKPMWLLSLIAFIVTLYLFDGMTKRKVTLLILTYTTIFVMNHFPLSGEVSYFDVGQGDSFLIREPFNRSITLIDTGGKVNFGHHTNNDQYQAEQTSINYLKSHGINYIDNICISHQDADHCGDLPAFLKLLHVKRIYVPWGMQYNASFMNKIHRNASNKVELIPVRAGDQIDRTGIRVYHPFKSGLGKNENSMVLGANINHINWLFTGDLDQNGELETINHYPQLSANVLKLGHHGSKTSSAPTFLDQIKPQIVIISAGRNNRYHHPNEETISRIHQRGLKIYNTQEDGMITYRYLNNNGYFETMLRGIH